MSAHVLLNLLNKLGTNAIKCEAYDIKITLKSHFFRKKVITLSLCICNVVMDVITFSENL